MARSKELSIQINILVCYLFNEPDSVDEKISNNTCESIQIATINNFTKFNGIFRY
jgi:hypothetical protein